MVLSGKSHTALAEVVGKLIIGVELLEGTSEDFSLAQKARKYLRKLGPTLTPEAFSPPLTLSEVSVLMQIRPMFVDLAVATGLEQADAVQLLPLVD